MNTPLPRHRARFAFKVGFFYGVAAGVLLAAATFASGYFVGAVW